MNEPQPPPFTASGPSGPTGPDERTDRPVGWMVAVLVLAVLTAVSVTALVMTIVLGDGDAAPAADDTTTTTAPADTTTTAVPTTETPTTAAPPASPDPTEEFCAAWWLWEDELAVASDVGPWVVDRWADLNAAAQSGPPELRADVGVVARYYADLEAAGFALGEPSAAADAEFLAASDRIDAWAAANC